MTTDIAKVPVKNIQEKEITAFKATTGTLESAVEALKVIDTATLTAAGTMLAELKAHIKSVKARTEPITQDLHQAHKKMKALENDMVNPAKLLIEKIDTKTSAYLNEQERKRRETERLARIESERLAQIERDKINKAAEKALDSGDTEQAEALLEDAETVVAEPVFIEKTVEKSVDVGGSKMGQRVDTIVHMPETIEDIKIAFRAIADGLIDIDCAQLSMGKLKAWAKKNRKLGKHHGVTFTENRKASLRREL
jgi:hypothetical protein